MATVTATAGSLESLLGDETASLLEHRCETVPKEMLHLPGPDFVDRVWALSDRPPQVLRSLQAIYVHHDKLLLRPQASMPYRPRAQPAPERDDLIGFI